MLRPVTGSLDRRCNLIATPYRKNVLVVPSAAHPDRLSSSLGTGLWPDHQARTRAAAGFIDAGSWHTGVQREGRISVQLDAQSEHIPGRRMHLKAAIGACGNDPDRVLRSVIPHVAIANPAFVPDAWRIQEDGVPRPARAPY
jgi:hypothetical protein